MRFCFVIRSKYGNTIDPDFNRRRLELTKANIAPALKAQTDPDFDVAVWMEPTDPLESERREAYQSLNCVPAAPKKCCQIRVDDDDLIAADFVERLKRVVHGPGWYTFPEGYIVRPDGVIFHRRLVENQFVARVGGSVYELNHRKVPDAIIIDEQPAWAWVQHPDSTIPPHRMPTHCHGFSLSGVTIHELLGVNHAS